MPEWKIPLFEPDISDDDIEAAIEPLRERWLTMGERTQRFERAFEKKLDGGHAVALCSCTAALHLSLLALEIGPGDEVIVPSLTFAACANVIIAVGAKPVFADICGPDDWTIDPEDIQKKITKYTKAVIAVHYAGFPCRMDSILAIARQNELFVIEDCAHALVSSYRGTSCGLIGDVGCFSFFSNKNMTTGEGGMAVSRDESIASRIRLLRSHGMTTLTLDRYRGRALSYDITAFGLNYRPSEIVSSLGLSQLGRLDRNLQKRREIYTSYIKSLMPIKGISIPFLQRTDESIGYHIFPILLDTPDIRESSINQLKEKGIQTSIHYPPIHKFSIYRQLLGDNDPDCPITEDIAGREVTLPFYPFMNNHDIDMITAALMKVLT